MHPRDTVPELARRTGRSLYSISDELGHSKGWLGALPIPQLIQSCQ